MMTARFEGDVQGGAARRLSGGGEGVDLGVRLAVTLVPALAYELAVAHHDRADEWIRLDATTAALGQLQGAAHPIVIASWPGLHDDSPETVVFGQTLAFYSSAERKGARSRAEIRLTEKHRGLELAMRQIRAH
jgi:hypothetical protein